MTLTGKCKEDFYYWFDAFNLNHLDLTIPSDFETYPDVMKFGVYADFFDSVGILISTFGLVLSKTYVYDISIDVDMEHYQDGFASRPEARLKAIEKANEIYNNQK